MFHGREWEASKTKLGRFQRKLPGGLCEMWREGRVPRNVLFLNAFLQIRAAKPSGQPQPVGSQICEECRGAIMFSSC